MRRERWGAAAVALAVVVAVVAGCGDSDGGTFGSGTTVIGVVFNAESTGSPGVPNVVVTGGGETTSTDSAGRFLLPVSPLGTTVLTFEKTGYPLAYRAVTPGGAAEVTVTAFLATPTLTTTVDVSSGPDVIEVGTDLIIELPQDSLEAADGTTPSGPVNASVTWLDRSQAFTESPVPLMGSDGQETYPLVSYGMFDVTLEYQGQPVALALGAVVTVRVAALSGDPSTAELFSIDVEQGVWWREDTATNDWTWWTAELPHLSWWNIDGFIKVPASEACCVEFVATTIDGDPRPGIMISSLTVEFPFTGTTGGDGTLCNEAFWCGRSLAVMWAGYLDPTAQDPVGGVLDVTPSARGARCGSPDCQRVPILVLCDEDTQCGAGQTCSGGSCSGGSTWGSDGGTSTARPSCDLRSVDGTCLDFVGSLIDEASSRSTCDTNGGTYSQSACTSTGRLGRCQMNPGTTGQVDINYYSSTFAGLEAELKDGCETGFSGIWVSG